ncbi:hypothetical protein [Bradyrhizobium sp. BR 1432]|uniref:hypothetical protein n=1 Tax=Bradyrhizobium sp. BR 1432 TaxID=3447966 RepID=UPI003EE80703
MKSTRSERPVKAGIPLGEDMEAILREQQREVGVETRKPEADRLRILSKDIARRDQGARAKAIAQLDRAID